MNWYYLVSEGFKLLADVVSGLQLRLSLQAPTAQGRIDQNAANADRSVKLQLTYNEHAVNFVAARALNHAARIVSEASSSSSDKHAKKGQSSERSRPQPSAPPANDNLDDTDVPGTSKNDDADAASDDELCIICMNNRVGVVLVPCGHLKYCGECAEKIRECSFCRVAIERRLKVYR
ncbi:hypothetical protein AAVH_05226 [Aphelenchoides avenae]|nr:hypothetical protein AAVH_05226 [Aphelenchus avenae]